MAGEGRHVLEHEDRDMMRQFRLQYLKESGNEVSKPMSLFSPAGSARSTPLLADTGKIRIVGSNKKIRYGHATLITGDILEYRRFFAEARMKPIYMSANFDQVDTIKKLLRERGVETALQAKEDSNNPLTPKGIIWFELWLRRQGDEEIAETIIEKYEIGQLKNSLKVTWKTPHKPAAANAKKSATVPGGSPHAASQSQNLQFTAYESWLPVNNQRVFHRLASTLKHIEAETTANESDKKSQPWNPENLKSQVQALQQICKLKSSIKTMSNS